MNPIKPHPPDEKLGNPCHIAINGKAFSTIDYLS
jgi:hypothetical protein